MKRFLLYICFFCFFAKSEAQNLVPNPSFEDTITTPNWTSGFLEDVTANWLNLYDGSADYYSDVNPYCIGCATLVHTPRTGLAYTGIFTFQLDNPSFFHEAIEVELSDSLVAGKKYCVSFYVCLYYVMNYSCANIGAYFSDTLITNCTITLANYIPQVANSAATGQLLTDSVNWTLISGSFIATGGEKFMTISNFLTDQFVDTIHVGHEYYNTNKCAYYFIDDVSVIPCDTIAPPPPTTENYLFIPNAFSPNGDGNNDVLFVRGKNIQDVNLSVYDRWGRRVFQTNNIIDGWDGKYNGEEMENGVFVYYLFVSYTDGKTEVKKGNVSLIK